MVKIKTSELIANIRGGQGNHVYSEWRGTSYLRSKAQTRSNPRSADQAASRAMFGRFSQIYNSFLTPEQRVLWLKYAVKQSGCELKRKEHAMIIPYRGYRISGFNAFVQVNSLLQSAGILTESAFRSTPPNCTEVFPGPTGLTCEVGGAGDPYAVIHGLMNLGLSASPYPQFEYNQPFSGAVWMKPQTLPLNSILFTTMSSSTGLTGWEFALFGGFLTFKLARNWPTENLGRITGNIITTGSSQRLLFTYDGSNTNAGIKLYVNGAQLDINNYGLIPVSGSIITLAPLHLFDRTPTYAPADGTFDEAVLWNKVLSPAEILADWNAGAGMCYSSGGNRQLIYHFDQWIGNVTPDSSGNGYDGTWLPPTLPVITPSPLSVCPGVTGVTLSWTAPSAIEANARARIWTYSENAGVHRQLIATVDAAETTYNVTNVRVCQGKSVPINSVPGEYLFQIDVVEPSGRQSAPSNLCRVMVPAIT